MPAGKEVGQGTSKMVVRGMRLVLWHCVLLKNSSPNYIGSKNISG
jgi:hypothetical protein